MEEKQSPKFSLVEIIIIMLIVVPLDILELTTDLIVAIPVIGLIIFILMRFVDLITSFLFWIWFKMKGVGGTRVLIGNLLGAIPFVRTITMTATIIAANNPKIEQAAEAAQGLTGEAAKGNLSPIPAAAPTE